MLCLKLNKTSSHFLQHSLPSRLSGEVILLEGRGCTDDSFPSRNLCITQTISLSSSFPGIFRCQAPLRNSQHIPVLVGQVLMSRLGQGELRTVGKDRQIAGGLEWPERGKDKQRSCVFLTEDAGPETWGTFYLCVWKRGGFQQSDFQAFFSLSEKQLWL